MYWLSKILGAAVTPIRNLLYWISRALPGLRTVTRLSAEMRFALLTFLFLLIIAGLLFLRFRLQEGTVGVPIFRAQLPWPVIIILLFVIPACVYVFVKLLRKGTVSRFPDIDLAWELGLARLKAQGIRLDETPLFIVFGTPDEAHATNLFRASQLSLNVSNVPEGPAAMHWFANQDAIFLVLTNTSCASSLAERAAEAVRAGANAPIASPAAGRSPTETIVAGAAGGTVVRTAAHGESSPGGSASQRPASTQAMQTLQVDPTQVGQVSSAPLAVATAAAAPKPTLSPAAIAEQCDRLAYVCHLLRKERYPLCAANGLLTVLPFGLIDRAADQLQAAIQRDTGVLRDGLRLRCPLTLLVSEMEQLDGFRELVRRVGIDRAREQRFGKGFDVWTPATEQRLRAVAANACGAFEDWTYTLFREHDALRRPGNAKLFGLLCKIRGQFAESFERVVANGIGSTLIDEHGKSGSSHSRSAFLFAGCYFGATGDTEDRQAFVKSVLLKTIDLQSDLEWNPEAVTEHERYLLGAHLFTLVGLGALGAAVYLLVRNVWG